MALVEDISKAYNSIKAREVEHYVRRYLFRISQNEPWKVYGAVYIRWMCFKDKYKVIEGNLSYGCSQDTDFNPEIHNFKSSLVTSKARVAP